VQGRDGLLLADPDARDDRPLDRKRPAEQPAGGMDAPLRQQFPDAAARHALASHFDGGQDVEPESFLASEFSEQRDVTRLTVPEPKVRTDLDGHRTQPPSKYLAHELRGREA